MRMYTAMPEIFYVPPTCPTRAAVVGGCLRMFNDIVRHGTQKAWSEVPNPSRTGLSWASA